MKIDQKMTIKIDVKFGTKNGSKKVINKLGYKLLKVNETIDQENNYRSNLYRTVFIKI
jgi:hypothetical protein